MSNSKISTDKITLLKQISLAAHDLNNALSVVSGYPGLLQNLPYEAKRTDLFLEQIKIAMLRAADSTKLLLALGRCAEPEVKEHYVLLSLKNWLNSVQEQILQSGKMVVLKPLASETRFSALLSEPLFKQLMQILLDQFIADNDYNKLQIALSADDCSFGEVKISCQFWLNETVKPFLIDSSSNFAHFVAGMIIATLNGRMEFNPMTENLEIYLTNRSV